MDNINDYAEKYATEVVSAMLDEGVTAIGAEVKKLLLADAKQSYTRGFRDSQSIEWSNSIKKGGINE